MVASVCQCGADSLVESSQGPVRISRNSKGRGGKTVTLITGIPLAGSELKQLAKKLKALCGTGGTVKDNTIEIQGDHRDKLVTELAKDYPNTKASGG